MVILENIDIDIDKAILQNIDIDKISNRFKFGISNRATRQCPTCCKRSCAEVAFVRFLSCVQVLVVLKNGAGFESSLADLAHMRTFFTVGLHVALEKMYLLCCVAAKVAVMTSSMIT